MLTLILSNWKLVLIGLLVASTGLFYKLWREDVRAFTAFKIQTAALGEAAKLEKARIEADHAKVTKEIKDAIPKQIASARSNAVRNYIASMPNNSSCSNLPSAANSPSGTDAASKEPVVACRTGFIQDCAQDAAAINAWQTWARGQQFPVR